MTPEDIERFGYGNEAIFLELEQRILEDIVRRIKNTGVITRSADYQMNRLIDYGYSEKEIKELLRDTMAVSEAYIDAIYQSAIQTDYIDNKKLYEALGKEFISFEDNDFIQQLVSAVKEQTKAEIQNITRTLGFVIRSKDGTVVKELSDFYREFMDKATSDIMTGTFDYNTTLRRAIKKMTNSGIRWIDYESGHHNRITVASRRSVFTGLSNLSRQIANYNAEQLGTEYFEVAWHANARPTHRRWHGQVWSKEELVSVCGLGTPEGLCGSNCYHVYYPFIKGLSKRNWTDEWLEEQNAREDTLHSFNGREYTAYEATQRQRELETRMRAQREAIQLLKDGGGSEYDILNEQAKYRATMDEYARFSKEMNLRQQKERIYMDGYGKEAATGKKLNIFKEKISTYKDITGIVVGDSGLVSADVADHFIEQAINRGINAEIVIDALKKPLDIGTIKVDSNGWSQKIIGEFATIIINPGNGKLITVYRTGTKRADRLKRMKEG